MTKEEKCMNKTFKHFKEMITEVLPLKEEQAERLEAPIKEGKWSIREIVAHLYGWDQFNFVITFDEKI